MIRTVKSGLIVLFGLLATIFALHNIANFDIAITQVAYVLSQVDHEVFPTSLTPAIASDMFATAILCLIITCELATGAVLLKGGIDMLRAVGQSAAAFEDAKSVALLGCLLAIGVWFGLFVVIGGGFYQMWQTPLGRGSFNDSVTTFMMAGMLFLIIRSPDK